MALAHYPTGTPVHDGDKLVRLGIELQHRDCRVAEHVDFPPYHATAHMKGSKHPRSAFDVNRSKGQRDEWFFFAHFGVEAMARGFGCIHNRQPPKYPGDHLYHAHLEVIERYAENYAGRFTPMVEPWTADLRVDGSLGPRTISALQTWAGTPVDGVISPGGSSVIRALQAYLNTEENDGLAVDGKFGRLTGRSLSAHFGWARTNHTYLTSGHTREIQRRLNKHGHLAQAA